MHLTLTGIIYCSLFLGERLLLAKQLSKGQKQHMCPLCKRGFEGREEEVFVSVVTEMREVIFVYFGIFDLFLEVSIRFFDIFNRKLFSFC